MDNLDILMGLGMALVGGLLGWTLRARRSFGERLRVAQTLEGRTHMAEKDLALSKRQLTEARMLMKRIQDEHGNEGPQVTKLKHQLDVLGKELSSVRRELLDREQVLERFEADDLSLLPGVGPVLVGRLREVGVECFEDLAAMDENALRQLAEKLNLPLRTINRHDWPTHAAKLANLRGVVSS